MLHLLLLALTSRTSLSLGPDSEHCDKPDKRREVTVVAGREDRKLEGNGMGVRLGASSEQMPGLLRGDVLPPAGKHDGKATNGLYGSKVNGMTVDALDQSIRSVHRRF